MSQLPTVHVHFRNMLNDLQQNSNFNLSVKFLLSNINHPYYFHIHLGLKLVNRLSSSGGGPTEMNDTLHGRVYRSIIPITHTNDSSILSTESADDRLDCRSRSMQSTDASNKLESDGEKVSDDDFYVDDFESDNDGDANDEQ